MLFQRLSVLASCIFTETLAIVDTGNPYPGTTPEGVKFLEAKRQEKGVYTLPTGLMYKVLKHGTGDVHPTASTPCDCHYKGTLISGTQFDSSYDRGQPTTFAPNQVIPGWTEAMQLMVEGDKWEMFIPSHLAYGARGAGGQIPGGAALIFTMEIMKINGPTVEYKQDLQHTGEMTGEL